jgi:hypothetical protein
MSHKELTEANCRLAAQDKKWVLIDAYSGGCGATISAIQAGVFVKTAFEAAREEIAIFEQLTNQINLGPIDYKHFEPDRIPRSHLWWSSSQCKDYSSLGSRKGAHGSKGGDHFPNQSKYAAASGSLALMWENVGGVTTLNQGLTFKEFKKNCKSDGFTVFLHKEVIFAQHGDPENRMRCVGVAFNKSVDTTEKFEFPEPDLSVIACAAGVLECSSEVSEEYWDYRPWFAVKQSWKTGDRKIFTLGYCSLRDRIGYPMTPSRVFHPLGLLPTCLASGNTGLVRTIRLRALDNIYCAWVTWVQVLRSTRAFAPRWKAQRGGLCNRRMMPSECFASKGYTLELDVPDEIKYRCAGNMVPIPYTTRFIKAVVQYLERAGKRPVLKPKCDEYRTFMNPVLQLESDTQGLANCRCTQCKSPVVEQEAKDQGISARIQRKVGKKQRSSQRVGAKVRKGWNRVHNASREQLNNTPLSAKELSNMSALKENLKFGRYSDGSMATLQSGIQHWYSFCNRARLPRMLIVDTPAGVRAATAQAEAFVLYELANFDITATVVNRKLWAVDQDHKAHRLNPPFKNNELIRDMMKTAMANDDPSKSKVPLTERQMLALRNSLDLGTREGFCLWTGLRFAIAFLCRISEWAVNEKHTLIWRAITFFDKNRQPMEVKCWEDVALVYEMEVIFFTDKTHGVGDGVVRSFFAIPDLDDDRCIVRDMAALWLQSEQIQDYAVFSWNGNEDGIKRAQVNKVLKASAVAVGISGGDVASHSCRITGLSRLLAQGMPFHLAREHGRWSKNSTCVLKYFWPHTTMARDFAAAIWEASVYSRVRGGGAIQYL